MNSGREGSGAKAGPWLQRPELLCVPKGEVEGRRTCGVVFQGSFLLRLCRGTAFVFIFLLLLVFFLPLSSIQQFCKCSFKYFLTFLTKF